MKTQMKFQKILALVCLITGALAIVLSLFYCSGILYSVGQPTVSSDEEDNFNAYGLFKYSQSMNDVLLVMSIILLLTVVLLYIMQCTKRRNYYISNYVAIGIFAVYALAFAIAIIAINGTCFGLMSKIDFEAWYEFEQTKNSEGGLFYPQNYTKNCATMILFIVLAVVILAEIAGWVLNLIWKLKLMKGEKELLEKGAVSSSAEMEVA